MRDTDGLVHTLREIEMDVAAEVERMIDRMVEQDELMKIAKRYSVM